MHHKGCYKLSSLGKNTEDEEEPCCFQHCTKRTPVKNQGRRNVELPVFLVETGSELTNVPMEICFSAHELYPRHGVECGPKCCTSVSPPSVCHVAKHQNTTPHPDHPSRRHSGIVLLVLVHLFHQAKMLRRELWHQISMFEDHKGPKELS